MKSRKNKKLRKLKMIDSCEIPNSEIMLTGSFLGFLPPLRLGLGSGAVADGTITGPLLFAYSCWFVDGNSGRIGSGTGDGV